MNDLVTWLRQQLDDDERVAKTVTDDPTGDCWFDCTGDGHGDHHLRWDPARVLAEVDAKRRILDAHTTAASAEDSEYDGGVTAGLLTALRLLALPYADRRGYRDEWKP